MEADGSLAKFAITVRVALKSVITKHVEGLSENGQCIQMADILDLAKFKKGLLVYLVRSRELFPKENIDSYTPSYLKTRQQRRKEATSDEWTRMAKERGGPVLTVA